MGLFDFIGKAVYDATTAIISRSIAITTSTEAAGAYRQARAGHRSYLAANLKGPYQLHTPGLTSGDREVLAGRRRVNNRVKDQERNNPFVAGIIRKNSTAVVGDEIGFKAATETPDGRPNVKLNRILDRRFNLWMEHACIDGESLTDACHLVENMLLLDGEVIVKDDFDGQLGENPYRIQILESEHIDSGKTLYGYGCEFDSRGRAVAWWVYPQFPDGSMPLSNSVRVPASDMLHLFERTRASQRRGISPLASALHKIFAIDDLEDAELLASRAAAAFGLIIESPAPDISPLPEYRGEGGTGDAVTDDSGQPRWFAESGGVFEALPGEKVSSFKNERPNPNFEPFRRGAHRISSHSVAMSYESATGDFSQVNYSSAKMGRNVEWANIRRRQARIKKLLNRTYRKWLRYEVAIVGVPGISASAYNRSPEMFEACTWQLSGNDGIDPVKEIAAFESELTLGVNSRTRWCAERGRDFEETAKETASEKALLKELGIYQEDPAVTTTAVTVAKAAISAEQPDKPGDDNA